MKASIATLLLGGAGTLMQPAAGQSQGARQCTASRADLVNVNLCNPGYTFEAFAAECSGPSAGATSPEGKPRQSCQRDSDCAYEGCIGEGYVRSGCGSDGLCYHDIRDAACVGVPWNGLRPSDGMNGINDHYESISSNARCTFDNEALDNPGRRAYCPPRSCVAERQCAPNVMATPSCMLGFVYQEYANACGADGGCVSTSYPQTCQQTAPGPGVCTLNGQPTPSPKPGANPNMGQRFTYHATFAKGGQEPEARTQMQAEYQCILRGGHLASVHSMGEMQEIERLVPDNTDVWIGLNDRDTEGGCGADDFKCVRCSKLLFWVALFCLLTSERAQNG